MSSQRGVWINGSERPGTSGEVLEVSNPFDGITIGQLATASIDDVNEAVENAYSTFRSKLKNMPAYERAEILRNASAEIQSGIAELTNIVVEEAGKPLRDVQRELSRAIALLNLAASHVMVQKGQVLPMDIAESGINRMGFATRVPVGVVAAIAPSNSPVNLTINKVAPALAAGNAVVLKPADQTPFSSLWLAKAFQRAGLPDGALNVIVGSVENAAEPLVRHRLVRMVSITGGVPAGLAVVRAAGIKKVTLELGSSAANVVRADADIAAAAKSLAVSSYLSSGQACISAQRIIVHEDIADRFVEEFVSRAEQMVIGDPRDPATELGPMISQNHVRQVLGWISEARDAGARVLMGGVQEGRTIRPTLLADVPEGVTLDTGEAFAPVAVLSTFATDDEAIERVNNSVFGLQAGVFTNDITASFRFARDIDAGAVWINESSRYRQDNYPFGGLKLSGVGREGVQYAIEEMTEWKFVGFKLGTSRGLL